MPSVSYGLRSTPIHFLLKRLWQCHGNNVGAQLLFERVATTLRSLSADICSLRHTTCSNAKLLLSLHRSIMTRTLHLSCSRNTHLQAYQRTNRSQDTHTRLQVRSADIEVEL